MASGMFKSKTFWTAIAAVATATGIWIDGGISIVEYIGTIFAAFQTINIRHGIEKLGS